MRCLLVAAALAAVSARASAGNPLDKPAFTATPKELLDAAKHAAGDDAGELILRDNETTSFDDKGLATRTSHFIVAITSTKGIDTWSQLWRGWSPWFQDRPELRARVITRSGDAHELDATKLGEEPDQHSSRRYVMARLTNLEVGAVVEYETVTRDHATPVGARSVTFELDNPEPSGGTRIVFEGPVAMHLAVRDKALPKGVTGVHAVSKGRESWTYTFGALPAFHGEPDLPADATPRPIVGVTSASSWEAIAKAYNAVVEPQLKVAFPAGLPRAATRDAAIAIVSWVRTNIAFTGSPFDEEPLSPLDLDQVVKRGRGNSNELAALTTALLREAGMPADIVIIDRGPDRTALRDLPTLVPFQDAVVRAHIGSEDVWIDPSVRDEPIGVLDTLDQNRLALDVAKGTLITTPTQLAVTHETRTYQLAELGSSSVHEVSHEGGDYEAEARRWVRETEPAQLRKDLEGYAKRGYDAKLVNVTTTTPDDFAHPFEMTIDIEKAGAVTVHWAEIEISLPATSTTSHLPEALNSGDGPARENDLQTAAGHVYELEHRIPIPDGFAMPKLRAEASHTFGALTLRERQRADGRTLIIEQRLEIPQRRLTAAEVNATRAAVPDLRKFHTKLTCPNIAYDLFDKGKVREAFVETDRVIAAAPRHALPHARKAQLLLKIGDGDGARIEARKGVDLEPKNVDGLSALGWVLSFDLAGRQFAPGHDHAGARAALEKAHALAPDHYGVVIDLADLLERDARGRKYEAGSDLKAAAALRHHAYELGSNDVDQGLANARDLLFGGDAAGALAVAKTLPDSSARNALVAAATAIAQSPDASIATAPATDRKAVLDGGAGLLMMLRQYDKMIALFTASGSIATLPNAASLQKLKRIDTPFRPSSDPQSVPMELMLEFLDPSRPAIAAWDAETTKELQDTARTLPIPRGEGMTNAVFSDIMQSISTTHVEGDANAWRVEIDVIGKTDVVYLAADRGVPKVIGGVGALAGVGRHVLRLVGKHDDAAARLLDWVVKDMRSQRDLPNIWGGSSPRDAQAITLAGALLSGNADASIPAAKVCGSSTLDGQLVCDYMLARSYRKKKRWDDLLAAAESWQGHVPSFAATYPDAEKATALIHLGRLDEADQVIADVLAKEPTNGAMLGLRMEAAAARHSPDLVIARADDVAKAMAQNPKMLNEVAWEKLMLGIDLPGALEQARASVALDKKNAPALNTLAAAEAETGALRDAVKDIVHSIELAHRDDPDAADWYVLARVREESGLRDDAAAAYRRVTKNHDADLIPTTYDLATTRLKNLGSPKK
ncbi:MAG: DUF3857 domain-containing protein [Deltaproteobacteria bacterium]|nr:DUF3857 domain-containing protein [Deltaproteobacteria bacterium]